MELYRRLSRSCQGQRSTATSIRGGAWQRNPHNLLGCRRSWLERRRCGSICDRRCGRFISACACAESETSQSQLWASIYKFARRALPWVAIGACRSRCSFTIGHGLHGCNGGVHVPILSCRPVARLLCLPVARLLCLPVALSPCGFCASRSRAVAHSHEFISCDGCAHLRLARRSGSG